MGHKSEYLKSMGIDVWQLRETDSEEKSPDHSELDLLVSAKDSSKSKPQSKPQLDIEQMNLMQLSDVVANCRECKLARTRIKTVFGAGSNDADIMFIGEAPGRDEDLQGLPFVGRAGSLLTSMIAAMGYSREEVYICNVVKCRPPNNRDPSFDEARSCSKYLRRQIESVSPKVIVALGRISAHLLLDTTLPLARLRGKVYKLDNLGVNADLIVTYHPAYLLRKPSGKAKAWEDLWSVRQFLKEKSKTA